MTREVIFAPEALTDLLDLYDYIAANAGAERGGKGNGSFGHRRPPARLFMTCSYTTARPAEARYFNCSV